MNIGTFHSSVLINIAPLVSDGSFLAYQNISNEALSLNPGLVKKSYRRNWTPSEECFKNVTTQIVFVYNGKID
jgi:hypothetical protein